MQYNHIKEGRFIERPNRFIAYVEVDGNIEKCHVKNTGRCKELLETGVTVYVEENNNPNRKTKFSLISVVKNHRLINMDSQAPNKAVFEWLKKGMLYKDIIEIKPECKYGDSRFDFYIKTTTKEMFIEVKGVTLEEDGIVRFPDAPTERGVKHINELMHAIDEGYEAMILFVIQMKDVLSFEPNDITHEAFGDALREAKKKGVMIKAVDCFVSPTQMELMDEVEVRV